MAVDAHTGARPWRRGAKERELDEHLVRRALMVARRTALGVLGDPEAAADVAQEVALIALRRRQRLRDPDRIDGWLHKVATRAALGHGRSARRRCRRELAHAAADPPAAPDDGLTELLDLLAGLPHDQRAALTLRYVHDLPDAAIARALRCREGTVRSLLSRGRAALRDRLSPSDLSEDR
jgi:RNA polymerase sigma factor (sigma-70 family)